MLNSLFHLRRNIKWKGLRVCEGGASLPCDDRKRELFLTYGFQQYSDVISKNTLTECLGVLDLLDQFYRTNNFKNCGFSDFRVLDVGARNWRYVGGLAMFLSKQFTNTKIRLDGIEIDAYYLNQRLQSRYRIAEYFCKTFYTQARHLRYYPIDVRAYNQSINVVSWLFPFLDLHPHKKWGLPKRYYDPQGVANHVKKLLVRNGIMIMANQGQWEWEEAKKIFSDLKLNNLQIFHKSLHYCSYPIYFSEWEKK
ncbi:MAG: hypothetical protein HY072_06330 [Deltaproteobacteria bacterium]|nr:hypothetical protein [Deltaproteobacteria bacterium]